ncbi:MAG: hypothetical protein A2086_14075 [Spirochaetes bacterium GWD1_27_9]|nr:MAG: hypothetical protein A2Z98_09675 [Spirochaetes bacterium GWB1_27_13]OHD21336.1 MAG: hypothetical protein A2Y34_10435 [Spirochaetes bacterium GWC1_27_15]OHD35399.1 MAG: hypothetical protein A2086_14075 [Spirochaetes bacterium GWD1_27_9]
MYNLFVSRNIKDWDGKPFIIEKNRCINKYEFTDNDLENKYGNFLDQNNINEISRKPCIFTYEDICRTNPKFGLISEIILNNDKLKIKYKIINLNKFLTFDDLLNMHYELDIKEYEMNRTHWAFKEIDLSEELLKKDIILPDFINNNKSIDIKTHNFLVSLSFPGEKRNFIKSIFSELEKNLGSNTCFYDQSYEALLARPSLDDILLDIYKNRSKLIVVFLCKEYKEKPWCGLEFRIIKEKILEKDYEKIMYIKLDDVEIDGVSKADGFIDGRKHDSKSLAILIKNRIESLI